MAGFIFSIGGDDAEQSLQNIIYSGMFSPFVSDAKNISAGVLADFCAMSEGDNIYFFSKRKIYGVGRLICVGDDCKYKNYISADELKKDKEFDEANGYLIENNPKIRWFCLFEPGNKFFRTGVDIDDVLKYRPNVFKMLRAFEKKTFIKFDDEENQALKEVIYLRNRDTQNSFIFSPKFHSDLQHKVCSDYLIDVRVAVEKNRKKNGEIKSEMILEAALLDKIQKEGLFRRTYDYLSHQVIASPFKPLLWADKMDIFGYRYLHEFPTENKPVEEYIVLELKKEKGDAQTILQLMRYVDWICGEYSSGDYSRIKAYTVAHDYPNMKGITEALNECKRSYLSETHPNLAVQWSDVTLLKYQAEEDGELTLIEFIP